MFELTSKRVLGFPTTSNSRLQRVISVLRAQPTTTSNAASMIIIADGSSQQQLQQSLQHQPPGTIIRQTLAGTENSLALRQLKPMTTYEIRVQAENKLGLGPFQMPPLKFTTKEEGKPI